MSSSSTCDMLEALCATCLLSMDLHFAQCNNMEMLTEMFRKATHHISFTDHLTVTKNWCLPQLPNCD
jgi:hypothetical protein